MLMHNLVKDIAVGNAAVIDIEFVPTDEDTDPVLAIDLRVQDSNKVEYTCLWEETSPNNFRGFYDIPDDGPAGVWVFRWETLIGPNAAGEQKFNVVGSSFISEVGDTSVTNLYSSANYIVYQQSNGTYIARDTSGGPNFVHATDAASVTQSAITALGTDGGIIVLKGNLPWGSVPQLPKDISEKKLRIIGADCKITLSVAGPRGFDFDRTADHQTFQNIEITDLLIDCNDVGGDEGQAHVIIGSYEVPGTSDLRINFENITIRRVHTINVPSDTALRGVGRSRIGVSFSSRQTADNEIVQNYVRNILIEDVVLEGGIYGFGMTSGNIPLGHINTLVDNVEIVRCQHLQPLQAVPSGGINYGAGIHIGQQAQVGNILIRDCYCEWGNDVGVEVNNGSHVVIENVICKNFNIAFLTRNFTENTITHRQQYIYNNCKAISNDRIGGTGYGVMTAALLPFGSVTFNDCVYENTGGYLGTADGQAARAWYIVPEVLAVGAYVRRIIMNDCKMIVENVAWNNATFSDHFRAIWQHQCVINYLIVRNLNIRIAGVNSGVGPVSIRALAFDQPNSYTTVDIDGVDIDLAITGQPAVSGNRVYGMFAGGGTLHTFQGSIRNVRLINMTNTTDAVGLRVGSSGGADITIGSKRLEIVSCDLRTAATPLMLDTAQGVLGLITVRDNRYTTVPVPTALTGLVTATGKLVGATATGFFWRAMVQFLQGSGTAITAIDYSTNGGTTYTNLITQASAALPAGLGPQVGPLLPSDLIKVTFTGTQPTITLIPVDP